MITNANNLLNKNIRLLKTKTSKAAYLGILIAIAAIIIATLIVCYYQTGEISTTGIIQAQKENHALWVLNFVPFVFGFWGQYSNSKVSHPVSKLIVDQTQESQNHADYLKKQANYEITNDPVTDLSNKSFFYDRAEQAIFFANSKNILLAILVIEISNFNDIYDTLGDNCSDQLLKQISSRLRSAAQGADSVARIGGNLFSILLTDTAEKKEVELLAMSIQKALEQPFIRQKLPFSVHANIGITISPDHGEDIDTLIQKATVSVSMAGKSNEGYATYKSSFDQHSPRQLTLMSELRHVIERNELKLFYQPKISIQTNLLYGAEALIRWHHPQYGFISPDEFIPMAERTRMITTLTLWVLKEAFRQCANWRQEGKALIVSVNLSANDLRNPKFPELIADLSASARVQPEWIALEITEGSVMTHPSATMDTLNRLSQMGYLISIDDFGTGYSSLAYLKKMPLSELKIDRSFVQAILTSENDDVIVNATINLAHNLGFHVTAEGVESKEILDKLKAYGCDIAQGHLLSEPVPVVKFNKWMNESEWPLY